jgi:hypothetical protein
MTFGAAPMVVGLASGLALALAVLGLFRTPRLRALWLLAMLCLWCLATRPRIPLPAMAESVTLWTPGAVAPEPTGSDVDLEQGGAGVVALRRPAVATAHVRGHGLRAFDWRGATFTVASFEPPALPVGLEFASWRRALPLGTRLELRGSVAGAAPPYEVRLAGPAGLEDRAAIEADGRFVLRALPRVAGTSTYSIAGGPPENPAWRETIDVEVVAPSLPAVLWLEAAPSSESAFVRRWLAARGGVVAVRSRPSRNKLRVTSDGLPGDPSVRVVDLQTLERFDIAVVDPDGAASHEVSALRAAVAAGRLGLLWRRREPERAGRAFETAAVGDLESLAVRVRADDADPQSEPLTITALEIRPSPSQRAILTDGAGRLLAARRLLGAGWVGLTLLEGTFRWPLAGHEEDYERVWSALLTALAPPRPAAGWHLANGPVLIDRPLELAFDGEATGYTVEEPSGASIPLAPQPDELEPRRSHFVYWPRETGWHRLVAAGTGARAAWFQVQERGAWQAWQAARRQEDTRAFAARARETERTAVRFRFQPLPLSLPFALLLISLTAIWTRERLG